jgi:hypothetical protein
MASNKTSLERDRSWLVGHIQDETLLDVIKGRASIEIAFNSSSDDSVRLRTFWKLEADRMLRNHNLPCATMAASQTRSTPFVAPIERSPHDELARNIVCLEHTLVHVK